MVSRREFLKMTVAAGAGLVVAPTLAPRLALAQDGLEQYIGAPATVTDLTYDPEAAEVVGCIELTVGLYKASQMGQAGFGVVLEVSYTSGGNPVTVSSTTALSTLSKVEIEQGRVELEGCTEAPLPPDDLTALKGEAYIVKLG
jgi:hypothetical protein